MPPDQIGSGRCSTRTMDVHILGSLLKCISTLNS